MRAKDKLHQITSTRLHGKQLTAARAGWIILVLFGTLVWLFAVFNNFEMLSGHDFTPRQLALLQSLDLPPIAVPVSRSRGML